jgi:serine/threonine protein kinase
VYRAYDPDLDRAVALKLVRVPAGGHAAALAEAKALARLSHPNVVPVHDVSIIDEHVCMIMELVEGETLRRWVRGPGRTRREILRAYLQAGAALGAAHEAGLVHRDFKPDNAIMGQDGRVRVIDFGLACEASTTAGEVRRGAGTPAYMAPEQRVGGPVTPAAD